MAKASKTKPDNVFIAALMSAIATLNNLPAAPAFDDADLRKVMGSMGLPTKAIDNAVSYAQKQHEETHGDITAKSLAVIMSALVETEGVEGEALTKALKAALGVTRKDRKELSEDQKEEVRALYIAGGTTGQRSSIAAKFDVSDATVYNLTKDLTRVA